MAFMATGLVTRIYPYTGGTYIALGDTSDTLPQFGYFRLGLDHRNYDALYTLALSAAENRYRLRIRTAAEIVPTAIADVLYMVVDW